MVNWINLLIPFAYLGILLGSLATFSHLYRARKAARAASLAPWFGPHLQRNIYLSLLHLEPETGPKVPDSVLKAALLRRATEDIHRIIAIRNAKQALNTLLQRGSVGDDLWQRFLRAEKETEEELRDVVQEANAFQPNWGNTIFQTASEMANNALIRRRMEEIQSQTEAEKEWWEKKRAQTSSDFMKELDEGSSTSGLMSPKSVGTAASTTSKASDDDAVLVEGGGPAAQSQGGGGKKKKKNKH
ncbi:translocation protein [Aulographum hederae CBS 113979]|uniref:Translocation protein n=1 Tax=Aulographum hederae CBS 113979 TaxID=1176131 RepID=A0A6G1HFD9_9PEZI|nr:translocation protein [Aulographum hederae CBS 113979]